MKDFELPKLPKTSKEIGEASKWAESKVEGFKTNFKTRLANLQTSLDIFGAALAVTSIFLGALVLINETCKYLMIPVFLIGKPYYSFNCFDYLSNDHKL